MPLIDHSAFQYCPRCGKWKGPIDFAPCREHGCRLFYEALRVATHKATRERKRAEGVERWLERRKAMKLSPTWWVVLVAWWSLRRVTRAETRFRGLLAEVAEYRRQRLLAEDAQRELMYLGSSEVQTVTGGDDSSS